MELTDKVLVVIPAYNEEANIETVVEELVSKCPDLDYIVVNDGSRDQTAKICREKGYNLLDLPVNLAAKLHRILICCRYSIVNISRTQDKFY